MNIFVGNLAFTTTAQDLRQLFEPYGSVDAIRIMTNRETGRARGFGFVERPNTRAAQTAIDALTGTSLAGRALTVNKARPREPRREPRQPRWETAERRRCIPRRRAPRQGVGVLPGSLRLCQCRRGALPALPRPCRVCPAHEAKRLTVPAGPGQLRAHIPHKAASGESAKGAAAGGGAARAAAP